MTAPIHLKEIALATRVRHEIARGAAIKEIPFYDMPVWLFRRLDHLKAVGHIYVSREAALVIYADGSRILARVPEQLRRLAA